MVDIGVYLLIDEKPVMLTIQVVQEGFLQATAKWGINYLLVHGNTIEEVVLRAVSVAEGLEKMGNKDG